MEKKPLKRMTLREIQLQMRELGERHGQDYIASAIASGQYDFGKIGNIGKTGRREVIVYQSDFDKWVQAHA